MVEEAEKQQAARTPASALAPAASGEGVRGEHRIALPAGMRLVSIAADGGLLYLHLVDGEGRAHIRVLDAASGAPRARIDLEPAP